MALDFNDSKIQKFMEQSLGAPIDKVIHSVVPFQFGFEAGGAADVYLYKRKDGNVAFVTGDLIGEMQKPSDAGNYELLVIMKEEEDWGAKLIRLLAFSTLDELINSGETMGISNFGKTVGFDAVIFDKYATTSIDGKLFGIMLVIGITKQELEWKFKNGGFKLLQKLKEHAVYPRTIPGRISVVE